LQEKQNQFKIPILLFSWPEQGSNLITYQLATATLCYVVVSYLCELAKGTRKSILLETNVYVTKVE
jgi:hypothetical protein